MSVCFAGSTVNTLSPLLVQVIPNFHITGEEAVRFSSELSIYESEIELKFGLLVEILSSMFAKNILSHIVCFHRHKQKDDDENK